MTNQPNRNDDLHWLAFRYVCGELAGDEEEAFERRLAHDQLAREAVAEAVELQEGIHLAPPPQRKRFTVGRRLVWSATAACLLLGFGLWFASNIQFPDDKPGKQADGSAVQKDSPQAEAVALTWVEMQRQSRSGDAAPETPAPPAVSEPPMPVEDVMNNDSGVPQWLVIAFSDDAKRTKGNR